MNEPDESRDPHLREALRHAPDAQLQAPPALGEFILKEARAKARDPGAAVSMPAPSTAKRIWDWLARPAVATGFAGVMAATLVGLMWWDQPMDEALPRHPAQPAAPAAEKAAPVPPAAPVVKPESRPSHDTVTTAGKPQPARKKAAEASRIAQPGTAAPAQSDTAPVPVTIAPSPAPTPAAAPATRFADTTTSGALAKARIAEEQKRERSSMAPAEAQSRRAAAKAQLNESRLQAEGEAYTRVASVRAAMAAEPARWAWQRDNGDAQPLNDTLYAWLAKLDAATITRWQPVDATALRAGREIKLLLDGHVQHDLRVTDGGVFWQRPGGDWHFSPLAPTDLSALEAGLP